MEWGDASPLFVVWIVSLTCTFGWYRKWGGWTGKKSRGCSLEKAIKRGRLDHAVVHQLSTHHQQFPVSYPILGFVCAKQQHRPCG
jgi:hypothetical protein